MLYQQVIFVVAAENPKAFVTGNKDIINQGKHAVSTNTMKDIVGRYTEVLFICGEERYKMFVMPNVTGRSMQCILKTWTVSVETWTERSLYHCKTGTEDDKRKSLYS